VSYEKGCYLGQEPIARMHYRGHPNWQLVGLTTESLAYPIHLDDIKILLTHEHELDAKAAREAGAALSPNQAVGVELAVAETGASSEPDKKAAGRITSAVQSPRLRRPLLMGYVRAKMAEVGTKFRASIGGDDVTLTVIDLPLPGPIKGDKHA
jgi:folate-binding Fe-S cluster repair protein YgfZ